MSDVKIRVKRSNQTGVLPGPLALGELAVNIPDKKIFIGNGVSNTLLYDGTTFSVELAEQVRDLMASTLVAGDNVNIDYDDTNDTITISLSPDIFQNLLQSVLVAGEGIALDYNNTNDTVTISAPGSIWSRGDATQATDIFGIPQGTTFAPGTDAVTILEQILYPYAPAAISSFTIGGNTAVTLDLGQTYASPNLTWNINNLANANTLTITVSGLLNPPAFTINPPSNQTNYNLGLATVSSTTAGQSLTFQLTVTQDNNLYGISTVSRSATWRPKIYIGRSTQTNYLNITNITALSNRQEYFVYNTSPNSPSGGIIVPPGPGFIYILVHTSINDLSSMDLNQNPGQLLAFTKQATTPNINNGYTTPPFKVYKSNNELTGEVRLDFT